MERRAVLQLKRNSFHEQVAKVNMFVHVHMCTYLNSGWVLLCFPALVYSKKKKKGGDEKDVRVTIVKKSIAGRVPRNPKKKKKKKRTVAAGAERKPN